MPRPAPPHHQFVAAIEKSSRDLQRTVMAERLAKHGPNDPEVVAYDEQNRATLRSTQSGRMMLDLVEVFTPILGAMEKRIRELEQRPAPAWCGAWKQGVVHHELEFVVDRGALWVAKSTTTQRPGSDDSWQLCTKRGDHG